MKTKAVYKRILILEMYGKEDLQTYPLCLHGCAVSVKSSSEVMAIRTGFRRARLLFYVKSNGIKENAEELKFVQ